MHERKVIFTNDLVAHDSYCGLVDKLLVIFLKGFTFQEVAQIIFDPNNLKEIKSYYASADGLYDKYKGFDQIQAIVRTESFVEGEPETIKVQLSGENVSVEQRLHDSNQIH